uniref:Prenyl transferase n=1 Tax=Compsopogon caeruleus TaxID=31354 RepID=A0A1Z1XBC0_9RHOD|nr:prenyl transferase [Compsopogon caeruleus]ARX96149.1 prenyl transferase [Compsopogon caeruleus]
MMIAYNFTSNIQKELHTLEQNIKNLVTAQNPILYAAAEHLFKAGGKRLRPSIVLLVAKATAKEGKILASQKRLAEITEIIHTASLLHDDVVDNCSTRRGIKTVNNQFNNRVAILAGDFLFAQSSWYLANLKQVEVVKIISKVITDFAEGEVRQSINLFNLNVTINEYIEKSFYKTASLIAASCQGAAMLAINNSKIACKLHLYGKHLGVAFQIIDDILDITSSAIILGKPGEADLKNGNLTAPCLFAIAENIKIKQIIEEEFSTLSDIDTVILMIKQSYSILKSQDLAREHLQAALNCLKYLDNSESKKDLEYLTEYIIDRLY